MPMTFGSSSHTARYVRAAMFGVRVEGIAVVRQARRVREVDTDELGLLCVSGSSWWVAQRLSDRLTVWAFAGDDEAWDGFDRIASGAGWVEAQPSAA